MFIHQEIEYIIRTEQIRSLIRPTDSLEDFLSQIVEIIRMLIDNDGLKLETDAVWEVVHYIQEKKTTNEIVQLLMQKYKK